VCRAKERKNTSIRMDRGGWRRREEEGEAAIKMERRKLDGSYQYR